MSVEHQSNGKLRLACDGEWCPKKFSPKVSPADPSDLRWRATMYGWLVEPARQQQPSIPGVDDSAQPKRDLCPECRRRP